MNAILAAAIIFVVFAVGDMISAKTKAIVSMLLVASVVFLAGFWTKIVGRLPPTCRLQRRRHHPNALASAGWIPAQVMEWMPPSPTASKCAKLLALKPS